MGGCAKQPVCELCELSLREIAKHGEHEAK